MAALAKYARMLSLQWSVVLQYRTDAFLWLAAETAVPLIALAIWYAVAASAEQALSTSDVLFYYVAVIFIKLATDAWNGAFLARDILNGEIVKDLIRPLPVHWRFVSENIAEKVFTITVPALVFTLLFILFPAAFMQVEIQPTNALVFFCSLALAFVLSFVIDHIIGTFAFWLEDAHQIRRYKIMLESIATGILIPFAFMPPALATALSFLPFRYIVSAPAEILTGQPVGLSISTLLLIQLVWVTAATSLLVVLWHRGLKRYAIPGQ